MPEEEQQAEVRASYNRKLNLGDYNSSEARITFSIPADADADSDELRAKGRELLAAASIDVHRQLLEEQDMNMEELADLENQRQDEHEQHLTELKNTLEEIKEERKRLEELQEDEEEGGDDG